MICSFLLSAVLFSSSCSLGSRLMATLFDEVEGFVNFLQQAMSCMAQEAFTEAKAAQVARMKSRISSVRNLGLGMAGEVVARLRGSQLLASEVQDPVSLVNRATQVPVANFSSKQGQAQDFRDFAQFMTDDTWAALHTSSVTSDVWGTLAVFLGSLGCVLPSESTVQHFTAAGLLLTKAGEFMNMDGQEKHRLYEQQKVWLKNKLRAEFQAHSERACWPYVLRLPMDPSSLPSEWVQDRALGQCRASSLWAGDVRVMAATIPMRVTHTQVQKKGKSSSTDQQAVLQLLTALVSGKAGPTTLGQVQGVVQPGQPVQQARVPAQTQALVPAQTQTLAQPEASVAVLQSTSAVSSALVSRSTSHDGLAVGEADVGAEVGQPAVSQNKAFAALQKLAPNIGVPAKLRLDGKQGQNGKPSSGKALQSKQTAKKTTNAKTTAKQAAKITATKKTTKAKKEVLRRRLNSLKEAGVPKPEIKRRQQGCKRCRGRPLCTQSCWKRRHYNVVF